MPGWAWAIVIVAIVVIAALAMHAVRRKQRTRQLQDRFGPEYDRAIERGDGRRDAEKELLQRGERRDQLDIRSLAPAARERYRERWERTQAQFVDDPHAALASGDGLVGEVMRERGYPVDGDFERRAADLSVDHPHLVDNYRGANRIVRRSGNEEISTEDQRQAMVHFRGLFDELLGGDDEAGGRSRESFRGDDTPMGGSRIAR
jgi:hypothetical protein